MRCSTTEDAARRTGVGRATATSKFTPFADYEICFVVDIDDGVRASQEAVEFGSQSADPGIGTRLDPLATRSQRSFRARGALHYGPV